MPASRHTIHSGRQWQWEYAGAVSGLLAGVILIVAEMIASYVSPTPTDAIHPLRLKGAKFFGEGVIDPSVPLWPVVIAGLAIHLGVSSIFGLGFGVLLEERSHLAVSRRRLLGAAMLYSLVIWVLNIYLIAPLYGLPWFPEDANPAVQAPLHVIGFGLPLAIFTWWQSGRRLRPGQVDAAPPTLHAVQSRRSPHSLEDRIHTDAAPPRLVQRPLPLPEDRRPEHPGQRPLPLRLGAGPHDSPRPGG